MVFFFLIFIDKFRKFEYNSSIWHLNNSNITFSFREYGDRWQLIILTKIDQFSVNRTDQLSYAMRTMGIFKTDSNWLRLLRILRLIRTVQSIFYINKTYVLKRIPGRYIPLIHTHPHGSAHCRAYMPPSAQYTYRNTGQRVLIPYAHGYCLRNVFSRKVYVCGWSLIRRCIVCRMLKILLRSYLGQ